MILKYDELHLQLDTFKFFFSFKSNLRRESDFLVFVKRHWVLQVMNAAAVFWEIVQKIDFFDTTCPNFFSSLEMIKT